ncbi:abortive infection system antitoxin AbiGi family protein [Flavobacterium sp. CAN_S2]|jgi:hypothetical protein|uniref:abortive infection system antitoxin AbiGi family protein n=1 Tax=Flavobacterium sp. CAN_S2 TaxID=2787726 RepID=UPI0018C947C0
MSNISSNCLFHFTSKAEFLIGILTNTFIPRYCYEETKLNSSFDRPKMMGARPMVCFCDISLSQINNHVKTYGDYGIGMTKEWGIRNKLNPLIYVNEGSELADAFSKMASTMFDLLDKNCNEYTRNAYDQFAKMSNFVKPYSGEIIMNSKPVNIRFYNEREWRFVPDVANDDNVSLILSKQDFENPIKLASENIKLQNYKLKFTPDDIKYIFVKNDKEIHSMITALRQIKGDKFSPKILDLLASKILTTKQIEEDF